MKLKSAFIFAILSFCSLGIITASDAKTHQWGIFEKTFRTGDPSQQLENPPQEVKMHVEFISPSGIKRKILGFWNGGSQWKVRFSPDEVGLWEYSIYCSDDQVGVSDQSPSDKNKITGTFECVSYNGDNHLYDNGELQLSSNRRYIEHQNGKPFFFLADTVWCGPAFAKYGDWKKFLQDRVDKKFTAIQFVTTQWRMFDQDREGNVTYTGHDEIKINPKYFDRLDRYVDAINEAGLVAVPVVLWALPHGDENPGHVLPEDQKIILAEYIIARYGAHQVMWFLGGDGNYENEKADTWKTIGQTVFNDDQHRLASMHAWGKSWVGDEFREEPWFDFIVYQSGHGDDDGTFKWLNQGPPATEWDNEPMLPVINSEPNYEQHNGYTHKKAHDAHSVRRAAYWSLLVSPTAGVTYGGQGIWGWHDEAQTPADHHGAGFGPPWYIAKDLPGAFNMMELHEFFAGINWWELEPDQSLLANQPGKDDPALYVTAAKAEDNDTAIIYMPVGTEIKINTEKLNTTKARWYHPASGGWMDAGEVKKPEQTFQPMDKNDWVLLLSK